MSLILFFKTKNVESREYIVIKSFYDRSISKQYNIITFCSTFRQWRVIEPVFPNRNHLFRFNYLSLSVFTEFDEMSSVKLRYKIAIDLLKNQSSTKKITILCLKC